jgi:hypothetical protein
MMDDGLRLENPAYVIQMLRQCGEEQQYGSRLGPVVQRGGAIRTIADDHLVARILLRNIPTTVCTVPTVRLHSGQANSQNTRDITTSTASASISPIVSPSPRPLRAGSLSSAYSRWNSRPHSRYSFHRTTTVHCN